MLASLAFPYTLDTGETITEGMDMECLKQGATAMPTNFRPQIWFQVIISVIGSCSENEIRTPAP